VRPATVIAYSSSGLKASILDSSGNVLSSEQVTNSDASGITLSANTLAGTHYLLIEALSTSSGYLLVGDYIVTPFGAALSYSLNLNFAGSGSGNVNGNMSCVNGESCTPIMFMENSSISLIATPDSLSAFGGWSQNCMSIDNICNTVIDKDTTVTVTFNKADKARIGNIGYQSLANAYAAITSYGAATIKLIMTDFEESLTVDDGKDIKLIGGFNADYKTKNNMPSRLKTPLIVTKGCLRVDGIVVK
jgi:hypothetical protein